MVRVLVEPACGAALAALYSGIVKQLDPDLSPGDIGKLLRYKFLLKFYLFLSKQNDFVFCAVVVVCGGNAVNLDLILQWKAELDEKNI
jgi:hypothetical protein